MKDFDLKTGKESIVEERKATTPKKIESALIGFVRPKPGQTVFEVNQEARTIQKATFEPKPLKWEAKKPQVLGFARTDLGVEMLSGEMQSTNKILQKPGCFYIPALNAQNIVRKLKNAGFGEDWEVLK